MAQAMQSALDALADSPALREYLRAEDELDALEQRIFDLKKRVDTLRPERPNLKLRCAVKAGILRQQFDCRTRRKS